MLRFRVFVYEHFLNIALFDYLPLTSIYSASTCRLEEGRELVASAAFEVHGFKFVRIEVALSKVI